MERAIELDPNYARAYVLLGRLYGYFGIWPELTVKEKEVRGRQAAKKAIELAPDMPAALVLLARHTEDLAAKGQLLAIAARKRYLGDAIGVEVRDAHSALAAAEEAFSVAQEEARGGALDGRTDLSREKEHAG